MAVKYIKDHKTQETVYPITKSECIIDAHSINNYEIDLLFDGSPEYKSSDSGMDYLNYDGLKQYHKKISEAVQTDLDNVQVDLTGYATESWVEELNYLKEHQDISGKVDVTDFEEATLVTSTALNYFGANKQDKTDTSLETENKTIVGAINEVNSKCEGSDVDLSNYLPLTGGTMTGDITFDENAGLHFQQAGSLTYSEQNGLALIADGSELHLRQDSINIVGSIYNNTGTISAAAFYETSDARKKDIKSDLSLDKCYDLIDKCQTVIYSLKDQTQELVGMIAQEIEEFFPEVVATDADGFKSLAYDRLVVICFKVLKDVIKRLEKLEL